MLRATFRGAEPGDTTRPATNRTPAWARTAVVPFLLSMAHWACNHPQYMTACVGLMASTSYVGFLQSSLFQSISSRAETGGHIDMETLLAGSKTLYLGEQTGWRWQNGESKIDQGSWELAQDLSVLTFVFPETTASVNSASPPGAATFPMFSEPDVDLLPSSRNLLSQISKEKTLAFSVPSALTVDFVASAKELPVAQGGSFYQPSQEEVTGHDEEKMWIMSAAKGKPADEDKTWISRTRESWDAFVDLLKTTEELDIIIMVLGYLSMHLTFVSLFISLRRLGSRVWLGTAVLLSSAFACLFGILMTLRFGVSLNLVLLSEGLPFLVVIIGFDKPIILTKAVLSASLALSKDAAGSSESVRSDNTTGPLPHTQQAIECAVRDTGYMIVRDYAIEILILIAGAASGVQGGLCQFCFLAAWILLFDCILLFTFYTAILTIKLDINRIKRHVAVRRALEEDGVSRRVAEEVAANEEWPKQIAGEDGILTQSRGGPLFGGKIRDSTVLQFKVLMITGFVLINLVNLCTIPFRSGVKSTASALSAVVTQPPMDPFKVAGSALERILSSAKALEHSTRVTVLAPIKYDLEYPSVHYAIPHGNESLFFESDFADSFLRGKVVEGVLKSFEDPFLSKWVIVALALSLALNGYLFNAARWSIKEPATLTADIDPPSSSRPRGESMNGRAARRGSTKTRNSPQEQQLASTSEAITEDDDPTTPRGKKRTYAECEAILKEKKAPLLDDEELIELSLGGKIPGYALEKTLRNNTRAVKIRRAVVARTPATIGITNKLESSLLPYENYDYDRVHGACCENVIGYLPLPLGLAGPITIDGQSYFLPMATTEGVLVASTSRGCKAINAGGGAVTVLTGDGMTRGPCVGFDTVARAAQAKIWLDSADGQNVMKQAFNSTSRFARLQSMKTALAGTYLYIRFKTTTGDAMGMNMISKGVEYALEVMANDAGFSDMSIITVSGNFCTDKKPAAVNWIDGRGKAVVAEAIIPGDVVRNVLKIDVDSLVELNISKNLIGSAMAGSIGGFNAHASNIVAAMFLATGQDPAQVVESSNCITVMKNQNGNLQISVSMPSIEVGTIGGGTILEPQAAMLDLLGVRGAHMATPGANARQLARIIAAGVLAGELSLCSALAAGHLVRAHMQHNRSQAPTRTTTPAPLTPTTSSLTTIREMAQAAEGGTVSVL